MPQETEKHSNDSGNEIPCQVCGKASRVWILQGYREGKPVMGHFCFDCADRTENEAVEAEAEAGEEKRARMPISSMMILSGFLVGIVGICGDYLGIRGFDNFGWYADVCEGLGGTLLVIGAICRVDGIVILGGLVLGFLIFSDLLGWNASGGIGWKQQAAIGVGAGLILLGIFFRKRGHGRMILPDR